MILCCGEALIDMIPNDDGAFVPHTGGAVFNTAIALGRLNAPTGLMSGVSRDLFGMRLRKDLEESHVKTECLSLSERPTTLAFVHLVQGQARYVFYDENSAGRMVQLNDMPAPFADTQALFFGGISLACEPAAQSYAAYLDAHSSDRVVMLDPNIRPAFIQDDAAYRARLDRMITRADIVKVSDEDLHWILQSPLSLHEKAEALLEKGPSLIIVTCGSDGAKAFIHDADVIEVGSQPATVIDTVGAGDTFNAGILASLYEQDVLSKKALANISQDHVINALTLGAKVAAFTVSQAGANPPWREDLDL